MSKSILIHEEVETADEMAELLRHIADMLDQGYTSGYHPGWELQDDE